MCVSPLIAYHCNGILSYDTLNLKTDRIKVQYKFDLIASCAYLGAL